MSDISAAPIPNETLEERQARLGHAVKIDEEKRFPSLQAFFEFCLDPVANGTGSPRTQFEMTIAHEQVGEGADELLVIYVAPRGFAYLTQRFNINTEDGNGLIANELIDGKKQYLANAARAARDQAELPADGVAKVRLGGEA